MNAEKRMRKMLKTHLLEVLQRESCLCSVLGLNEQQLVLEHLLENSLFGISDGGQQCELSVQKSKTNLTKCGELRRHGGGGVAR